MANSQARKLRKSFHSTKSSEEDARKMAKTKQAGPIKTITEDKEYVAAKANLDRYDKAEKRLRTDMAELNRKWRGAAPVPLDMEAILAGEEQVEPTNRKELQEEYQKRDGELKALQLARLKAKGNERKARQRATNRVAAGYLPAHKARVKKFHATLGPQYEVGLETAAMLTYLNEEWGVRESKTGVSYDAKTLVPRPKFQRHWLIGLAAEFYKVDGLPIPKAMRTDPVAVEELRTKHKVTVAA